MNDEAESHAPGLATPNVFCRACESPLVQAFDWEREGDSKWRVRLWCPECGHEQWAKLDRSHLLYLSLAVEEGFGWILEALAELDTVLSESLSVDFAYRARTDRIPTARH